MPAGPTGPRINIAEITTRANHDLGRQHRDDDHRLAGTSLIGWKVICAGRDCVIQS
jgi:hypothetical protein